MTVYSSKVDVGCCSFFALPISFSIFITGLILQANQPARPLLVLLMASPGLSDTVSE